MAEPKIIDIRDALVEMASDMTVDNGYRYDWSVENRDDLARTTSRIILSIDFADEANIDERQAVGVREYYQQRIFLFRVQIRKGSNVSVDEARIDAQLTIERAVADLKKKFNSTMNEAGDAGATDLQYLGFTYEKESTGAKYNPLSASVRFRVKYNESRF